MSFPLAKSEQDAEAIERKSDANVKASKVKTLMETLKRAKTPEEKARLRRKIYQVQYGDEGREKLREKFSKPVKQALEEDMASAKDTDVVETLNEILHEAKRQTKLLEVLTDAKKKHSRV